MPGHLGHISSTIDTSINFIEDLGLLKYTNHHAQHIMTTTSDISYGIVKNLKECTVGHFEGAQFDISIDGEIYEAEPKWDLFTSGDEVVSYLKEVDGYFSAVIFCKVKKQIILVTDLFGIKPLYLLKNKQSIAWSSEIKTIAKLSNDFSSLDADAVMAYLDIGFIPGNKTWYSDIQLLPAASVTSIDIDRQTCSTSRYWTWKKLPPKSDLSFSQSLEQFTRLLEDAVDRRINPNEKSTIALSGGLDSRTLLYLAKEADPVAFTFGHTNSDDVTLAKKVSALLGVRHEAYEYNQDNWLSDKIGSVWRTEGMMPFFHLHSSPFCRKFEKLGDTVLNGFGGATLLGGLFLGKSEKIKKELSNYSELDHDFYGDETPEAIIIDQHMRRFINQGSIDVGKVLVQRTPFMDRQLVMHLLSIPKSHRKHYRLFHQYLRDKWPTALIEIPWENTNLSIGNKWFQEMLLTFKWPSIRRILKLGRPAFNYPKLMDGDFKQRVIDAYLGPSAMIWGLLPNSKKAHYQKMVFKDIQVTGRLLSLEIWLRLINGQLHADEGIARF